MPGKPLPTFQFAQRDFGPKISVSKKVHVPKCRWRPKPQQILQDFHPKPVKGKKDFSFPGFCWQETKSKRKEKVLLFPKVLSVLVPEAVLTKTKQIQAADT